MEIFPFLTEYRGVTVCLNNDTMCITILGWGYDTKTIRTPLQRYDMIRLNDEKSIL